MLALCFGLLSKEGKERYIYILEGFSLRGYNVPGSWIIFSYFTFSGTLPEPCGLSLLICL